MDSVKIKRKLRRLELDLEKAQKRFKERQDLKVALEQEIALLEYEIENIKNNQP